MFHTLKTAAVAATLVAAGLSFGLSFGARPASASLFCDLCAIQGCGCTGSQCTGCGANLTANPSSGGTQAAVLKLNRNATKSVWMKVKGSYSNGRCTGARKK